MFKSTSKWKSYWKNRRIDWRSAYGDSKEATCHPHRELIIRKLRGMKFGSLCELGMGAGANLVRIQKEFPPVQLGGADVSAAAIKSALTVLPRGIFDVRSMDDLFFSDKSVDVCLTDMAAIYLSKKPFRKCLSEIKRITRRNVIFVEFHHKSWLKRLALWLATGYNAHDWKKELEKAGFHDVEVEKFAEEFWPGGEPQKTFGHVITASVL